MKGRCTNPNVHQWADYGGRGITVDPRWATFEQFVADMGERPPGYTLDRKDNNKGYSPENCQWADRQTQMLNRRNAAYVEIEGVFHRVFFLAKRSGLKPDTIIERAAAGLSMKEVVSPTKRVNRAGLALGGKASGAKQQAKTHCAHGHEFTPENTYFTKEGWRNCRECHRAKMRRRNDAKRALLG